MELRQREILGRLAVYCVQDVSAAYSRRDGWGIREHHPEGLVVYSDWHKNQPAHIDFACIAEVLVRFQQQLIMRVVKGDIEAAKDFAANQAGTDAIACHWSFRRLREASDRIRDLELTDLQITYTPDTLPAFPFQ